MKLLSVASKTWKELVRDRKGFGIVLGLPLVFMLIFGFAFGQSDAVSTMELAVLNQDEGAPGAPDGGFGANLSSVLGNVTFENGDPIFWLIPVESDAAGRALVEKRDVAAFLVVPPDFSRAMMSAAIAARGGLSSSAGTNLTLLGDPSYSLFNVASGALDGIVSGYVDAVAPSPGSRIATQTQSVLSSELTGFDFVAPGLMVFAVLNMAPQVAAVLARERERRTLERLRITSMGSVDLLGGVSLAQLAVGALSLVLMFATALLMGFHSQGSLVLAFGLAIATAFSVLGVGMIIAAFADKQDDAANLGVLFAVPASFLSGAFFPVPAVDLFEINGRVIQIYDVLPSRHAVSALREILTLGNGVGSITFEIAALLALTLLYFAIGAWLYARRRLRA